ncbi:MAG: hypothetical protein P1V51_00710 [Deltaproteobacteria bacterium]|nr:hypothetical protein [Deltaproteobacteria bacterium]
MRRRLFLLPSLVLALAACGAPEDDDGTAFTVADQVLSGEIAGQPWTFVQGSTNAFLSDAEGWFSKLHAAPYTSCDEFTEPDPPYMLVNVPTTLGEHLYGLHLNATFVTEPGVNMIGTTGGIIVTEITETTVTAGLKTSYEGHHAEGFFTVDLCP